jgi:starch synthase
LNKMAQREQGGALQQAEPLSVLMLAAEHGALKGAKVGGMADVIAGIVPALASIGVTVNVVMPDYGFLTRSLGLGEPGRFAVPFRHGIEEVLLYQHFDADTGATLYLLEHPLWRSSPGRIYVTSADGRPFADDADRFALFGVAVAEALTLGLIPLPERLHLHDWHQGFFALLRALDSKYQSLKATPLVLSIHNLALQGTRGGTRALVTALIRCARLSIRPICCIWYRLTIAPRCSNPLIRRPALLAVRGLRATCSA